MHLLLGPHHEGGKVKTVLLIGAGNDLAGDDGAGPAVISWILRQERTGMEKRLRMETVHTDILAIGRLWKGEEHVWIVDAMARGGKAGEIYRLENHELLDIRQAQRHAHALSLPENLRWLLIARPEMKKIRFRAWGIEADSVGRGQELTPAVAASVPVVGKEILDQTHIATPSGQRKKRHGPKSGVCCRHGYGGTDP